MKNEYDYSKHPIVFLHIGKNAGTTFKRLFPKILVNHINLKNEEDKKIDVNKVFIKNFKKPILETKIEIIIKYIIFGHDFVFYKKKQIIEKKNIKILFVIRDPVTRFISAFNYYKKLQKEYDYLEDLKLFATPDSLLNSITDPKNSNHSKAKNLLNNSKLIHFFKSQFDYFGDSNFTYLESKIFFVLRFENLGNDYDELLKKVGIKKVDLPLLCLNSTNKNMISKKNIKFIKKKYKKDYILFKWLISKKFIPDDYFSQIN